VYAYEVIRQSHDVLLGGGRIGCFTNLGNMLEDCQSLRPTVFAATPTFWNSLLSDFEQELARRMQQQRAQHTAAAAAAAGSMDRMEEEGRLLVEWRDRRLLGNRIQVLISTGRTKKSVLLALK
jgi:long-subunit acyl-CoA synthetase (AMP-forming)